MVTVKEVCIKCVGVWEQLGLSVLLVVTFVGIGLEYELGWYYKLGSISFDPTFSKYCAKFPAFVI